MPVTPHPDLALLLQILERHNVDIRFETGDRDSGFLILREKPAVFINRNSPLAAQINACLQAIKHLNLSQIHLPPKIRTMLGEDDWHE